MRSLRRPENVRKVPGSRAQHGFVSFRKFDVRVVGHCCDQLGDFPVSIGFAIERVGPRGDVQDNLRFGDVVRLANLPRNQYQARNNAEDADDLREVALIPVFHVSGIRW